MPSITLYAIPPPLGLSWSSPARLALTTAVNYLVPSRTRLHHYIGHVYVRFQSDNGRDLLYAGMTNDTLTQPTDPSMHRLLLNEGRGFQILFYSFKGRMQTGDEVVADLKERAERKLPVYFLKKKITDIQLKEALEFIREFQEKGSDKTYGLVHQPLKFEGSGCSAFGAACLEKSGAMTEELRRSWMREIQIPTELIASHGEKVSILKLLRRTWAKSDESQTSLRFWDPELMCDWLKQHELVLKDDFGNSFKGVEWPQDTLSQTQ